MSSRISEIILFLLLLVIAGFTRIYYGGAGSPMVVWKSEFGFNDTVVDVGDLLKLPRTTLLQEHPQVVVQLEEMGFTEEPASVAVHRRKPPIDHFGTALPAPVGRVQASGQPSLDSPSQIKAGPAK